MEHPWHSQEELGRLFLGQPVYLEPKGEGDHSILVKRELERRR
jgi:hypothetical protein